MKKLVCLIFLISITNSLFSKDILKLTNQLTFSGKVIYIKNCEIKFKATNGKIFKIPASDIHSVEFENSSDKVLTYYLNIIDSTTDKCLRGNLDGGRLHGKAGIHVGLGVLFGPFAVIGAAFGNPSPSKGSKTNRISENKNLFQDPTYLYCYKKEARQNNVKYTALGWLSWVVVSVFTLLSL
jgi:hypothetical protein